MDTRVIEMVRSGVVPKLAISEASQERARAVGYAEKWVDELTEMVGKGFITHPDEVGGYPEYRGEPYRDQDADGMWDSWELQHGLNPNQASDATADRNGDGYTHIEAFLYGLEP